jgi:cysteine-rich repeat protein
MKKSIAAVVCLLAVITVLGSARALALTVEQEAKLLSSDGMGQDRFGEGVALDGDTAIIGATRDDDNGSESGSAYVFTRTGGVWTEQAKLLPADGTTLDRFGSVVAISGDTAIIGAYGDGIWEGSAYVFTRTGGVWTQQAKLLAYDDDHNDEFGRSLALDGDTAIIGAARNDDNGSESGSAYVFTRTAGVWTWQAKLLASDGVAHDAFGRGVAIDGDTVLIGAPQGWQGGINGSAYIFTRTGGVWTEQVKLLPSNGADSDRFGFSVALDGDTAVIGAHGDNDNGFESGSAYVFTRTGGVWTEQAKLLASDGTPVNYFGWDVSLDGDLVVIGAYRDDDNGTDSGSAYVFGQTAGVWTEQVKLVPTDNSFDDDFGWAVALDGNTAVIGAPGDDDSGTNSGSAYVYRLITVCGDGILDPGEECDDGNNVDGDGCAADCTIEQDVPATSYRGMAVAALLLLVVSTAFLLRRRTAA